MKIKGLEVSGIVSRHLVSDEKNHVWVSENTLNIMKKEWTSPCDTCPDNETGEVAWGLSEYCDDQLKAKKVFCNKYHGWVVPCKVRQPTCEGK